MVLLFAALFCGRDGIAGARSLPSSRALGAWTARVRAPTWCRRCRPTWSSASTWLADAPTVDDQRLWQPVVRQQVSGAYMRGLAQMGVSYELGAPYGLATYFGWTPALVQVTDAVSASVAAGLDLRDSSCPTCCNLPSTPRSWFGGGLP